MRISFLLTLIFLSPALFAQDFDNYQPLKSEGEIPEAFRTLSRSKFEADRSRIDRTQSRVLRKTKEDFFLKSNFLVDQILLSGRILFNDPVTDYVNKVADELLKNDPALRDELQFYTVKSTQVNAFTTNNGIVLVNLGLIAQLQNEAQLAYVLAHEIIHFKNKHVINAYVENSRIDRSRTSYQGTTFNDRVLAKSQYSKDLEFEADLEGYQLYRESNYDLKTVAGVFDVLQYSYLPFDDVPFDPEFLETGHLQFPEDYFLTDLTPIGGEDEEADDDDSKSSHPSTRKRRKVIQREIQAESHAGRSTFLVSKDEFDRVQKAARFELSRLYLMNRDYGNAMYNSFLLLRKNPGNVYLRKAVIKSLYGMAKYKNEGVLSEVLPKHTRIEGESQQLYFLLRQLSAEEMNALALAHAWNMRQDFPEDIYLKSITEELMKELVYEHESKPVDYSRKPRPEPQAETPAQPDTTDVDTEGLSKYEKIKLQKREDEVEVTEENFMRFVFVDLFKDSAFSNRFEELSDEYEEEDASGAFTNRSRALEMQARFRERRQARRNGRALGIPHLVVVDPFYKRVDKRSREATKYLQSEAGQQALVSSLKNNAKLADLDLEILDTKSFDTDDVEGYNNFVLLNEWVNEQFEHDDMDFRVSQWERVQHLRETYNTDYFAWTGIINIRERKPYAAAYLCLGLISVYGFPFALAYVLAPDYETIFYFVVFDVTTGQSVMLQRTFLDSKDRLDLTNSFIYDSLLQVKSERKKK